MSAAPSRVAEASTADPAPSRPAGLDALHGALEAAGFAPRPERAPDPTPDPAAPRRARRAAVEVRREPDIDYAATAALAEEGFGAAPGTFTAEGLRWLYERAFTDGTTVLAAHADGRKVGHIALVHQTVTMPAGPERAVALMDLFIIKAFRSKAAMAALYGAVERFCRDEGIRFIVAVPNGNAAGVNVRYLSLVEAARLEIRVGFGGFGGLGRRVDSRSVAELDPADGRALLDRFCGTEPGSLLWTGARMWDRLSKPGAGYALHATDDLLLVSAPRRDRRAAHTLLCALLPRPGATPARRDVGAVVSAACRLHRRPLFVYAGINGGVPLPGMLLPGRLRPSPMILQLRDFTEGAPPFAPSRFEAIDFDFA
ncbi:GNAT family N-acetyltransferase [Lichenibacterium minor]|uniref:GNAT family N-acetyltransferase n=1 Tax=Lichenibacterium minor TaxID=2316528 RepID=UPI0013ECFFAD|nr:GNAT family N-acetyltransferase [Lichenibacterium minor]